MALMTATTFDYSERIEDHVREDMLVTYRRAWDRIAEPGTWWTGAERVAIAAESRAAENCEFCERRAEALSPNSETGQHDGPSGEILPPAAIDAIHRLVTDATRLTKSWLSGLADEGVPDTHYVELLSVVVSTRSIDIFHRVMGLSPEPLPEPRSGEPKRIRPSAATGGEAWVPMLPGGRLPGEAAEPWPGPAPYVIRAMSLVPDAVRWLKELSAAQYLSVDQMIDLTRGRGPLSRAQTELVAGRVSAINECFY
jgi:hypothetical protein